MNIVFSRNGSKVVISVHTKIELLNLNFDFSWDVNQEWCAELLRDHVEREFNMKLKTAIDEAYENGWKDKIRHRTKGFSKPFYRRHL